MNREPDGRFLPVARSTRTPIPLGRCSICLTFGICEHREPELVMEIAHELEAIDRRRVDRIQREVELTERMAAAQLLMEQIARRQNRQNRSTPNDEPQTHKIQITRAIESGTAVARRRRA